MLRKLLFMTIFVGIVCNVLDARKDMLVSFSNEWNKGSYDFYYLKVAGLNTNNIADYLGDLKLVEVFPFSLYGIDYSYLFRGDSFFVGMNRFKSEYLSLIDNFDNKSQYLITGIPIEKVKVYASDIEIYEFLKSNKNVQYSMFFNGEFAFLD